MANKCWTQDMNNIINDWNNVANDICSFAVKKTKCYAHGGIDALLRGIATLNPFGSIVKNIRGQR